MSFQANESLRWYQFEIFQDHPGLIQGIFTRQGGISPAPWSSLNMATSVGDTRERVVENRRRILDALHLPGWGFFDVWQVHGTHVIPAYSHRLPDQPHQKADAILTDRRGVALLMLFADCVPVFLYDPVQRVAGIAHAGWKGTVDQVAKKAVDHMASVYGSKPVDLLAGIGPSICQQHYEVGGDVIRQVDRSFGPGAGLLEKSGDGKARFDLWEANRRVLVNSGLLEDHIQISRLCTAESLDNWYSHRGEQGKTGRFAAVLAVQ